MVGLALNIPSHGPSTLQIGLVKGCVFVSDNSEKSFGKCEWWLHIQ